MDFIGTQRLREIVERAGLAAFIAGLEREIEGDFRRWHEFDLSSRHACHSPVGVIELMPISDAQQYSFKYVNGHPSNTADGLLTVTAFGVLADVVTGYPVLLSELTLTTALRTAATSALAARYLARPGSRTMALIGNGAQSEFQAVAFHDLLGIREIRLYDTDPRATQKLVRNLRDLALPGLCVITCESVAEAIENADIVTTVTADKRKATVLAPEVVRPGMHLNAVGGDCPGKTELHADILLRPDARVVVEYEAQSRIEGEIQQLSADFPVTELRDVVSGRVQVRRDPTDVTIFDSVGFALEDYSSLRYLYRMNRALSQPESIDLIPLPADPKDLFGEFRRARSTNTCLIGAQVARGTRVKA
jgi:ornithine cyclodeaminase